ncbi:hypothetical protein [Legionella sp. km772]|uniref:hypothetical protein n=1 Tax=Legionella sp. km772 TaxID=2498111 RepID=UPI000F8D4E2B|nr:hypothetical protein [Legionella sp. km772]RUR09734.1 hypothetical protein ELY15_08945 [Legionella sp. km772]
MPCWLFNLDAQQLTLELQTKLTKALLKSKTSMNASKQKTLDLLINESVQRILLDIHDSFEREFCGLCLCTLIYEHLLKKDSLNSLQMTLWTNLTVEKVKLAFNNEKIDEFCFYAELDYKLEGPHEPSIEELASKGMSTLQRLGNLEQFKIETSTLIDKFISTVPKNQYVVLIGNSPAYLYSLLAEQDYRVIILPLSGIKRCTLPKDEQGWGILINYVEQVIKAQAPAHQNPGAFHD